jgi:flagellar hook assembly protein FlgD
MKKAYVFIGIFILWIIPAYAVNFSPTLLKFSAQKTIHYEFDGSDLSIPVTVSGKTASAFFMVYTKDRASSVSKVRNGFLGWHYMNKIDTCVYFSGPKQLNLGTNTIVWKGTDISGNNLPKGTYTYYLWGYDSVSPKIPMTRKLEVYAWAKSTIVTHDQDGKPLANPIVYQGQYDNNKKTTETPHNNIKWVIGGDPDDISLIQTCRTSEWNDAGGLAFLPGDYRYFFKCSENNNHYKVIRKWEWVPNGSGVMQTTWGNNGEFRYTEAMPPEWDSGPGLLIKDNWLLTVNGDESGAGTESQVIYVDVNDGTEIKRLDLSDWYVNVQDGKSGGQQDAGPNGWAMRGENIVTNTFMTCINLLFDVNYEDPNEAILWVNGNGDITGDHNYEPTAKNKWVCNDYNVGPYKYNIAMDENLFSFFPSFDMGAVSFGLYAPDGRGLGYHAFAGETSGQKYGIEVVDYDSNFDGMYTSNVSAATDKNGWWFVAHDTIKGVISSQVGVAEAVPAGFSVAQNTPNPFNPSTDIHFSLAKPGRVTVEVYNAAGQKVDTLLNTVMGAGEHSVAWNGAKFAAGVYFYTVTSGSNSRTIKMTLLK